MSALLISLLIAFFLLCALLFFLDADRSSARQDSAPFSFPSGKSSFCDNRELASLGKLVFSDEDWKFIQREESPGLGKLYVQERRAVVIHWLHESAARLGAIRANHVRNARLAKNLDVFAEVRLMFLFLYVAFLCGSLLLIVRFVHPSTPRALALHFQSAAGRLLSSNREALAPVSVDQRPSLSP